MKHINPAQIKLDNFRKAMEEMKPGRGYAWAAKIDGQWTLFDWAESHKSFLHTDEPIHDGIPLRHAKRVFVAIVPMKEYRKLLKAK